MSQEGSPRMIKSISDFSPSKSQTLQTQQNIQKSYEEIQSRRSLSPTKMQNGQQFTFGEAESPTKHKFIHPTPSCPENDFKAQNSNFQPSNSEKKPEYVLINDHTQNANNIPRKTLIANSFQSDSIISVINPDPAKEYINLNSFIQNYNTKISNFPKYINYNTFLIISLLIIIFIQIPFSYYNFLNNIIYLINKDICEDFYILHIIMIILLSILISIPLVFTLGVEIKAHQNLFTAKADINSKLSSINENFTLNRLYMDSLEQYVLEKTGEKNINRNSYNLSDELRSKAQIKNEIYLTLNAFLNFKENIYACILQLFWRKNRIYFLISLVCGLVFNTLGFFKNRAMKILSIVFNTFILIFLSVLLFQYYSLRNIAFIDNETRKQMESILKEVS